MLTTTRRLRRIGIALAVLVGLSALFAPWIAPDRANTTHADLQFAPPTVVHIIDENGHWHAPFIYRWRLVSRLEQRYEADKTMRVPLAWLTDGHLVQSMDPDRAPLMLLGADSFGRDVFSRLLFGARVSLGIALVSALGALLIGALIGGIAGAAGGAVEDALMRASELVLVLPAIYVILALRAVMPLVLPSTTVFLLLAGILALVGSPFIAQGVRAIVAAERRREYCTAAIACGASPARVLLRHLLPSTRGFLIVELTVLVPAFVLAEATLSYVGMGFPDPTPSWGAMLRDASNISAMADFPWVLAPAIAIFLVVLGLNLILQGSGVNPIGLPGDNRP
jgi:peptide/nickel transport system permease protein